MEELIARVVENNNCGMGDGLGNNRSIWGCNNITKKSLSTIVNNEGESERRDNGDHK